MHSGWGAKVWMHPSNEPLRQGGATYWEGGLCVAAMARWPEKIKPGSVIAQPFWSPDLLIACAKLAGAKLPAGVVLDGKDPLPVLTKGAPSPHKSFFFTYGRHAALRMGNWKIVREKPEQAWKLHNLARDAAESKNLAAERPADMARLNAEFRAWLASVKRTSEHPEPVHNDSQTGHEAMRSSRQRLLA